MGREVTEGQTTTSAAGFQRSIFRYNTLGDKEYVLSPCGTYVTHFIRSIIKLNVDSCTQTHF